ncbi:hypothetical protein V6N13_141427 [Hibiscus sabdariffa]|uniref:Uncharacterized protein n=2 Tax=Hibiscus sabdariffa TaxID=183260 RepID=A0ABR2BJS8_9ROSI
MTTVAGSSSSSSPSGGLACAIAALAERHQTGGESSLNHDGNTPALYMLPGSSSSSRLDPVVRNYPPTDSPVGDGGMTPARDEGKWGLGHGSEGAEAGTSYSTDVTQDAGGISAMPQEHEIRGSFENAPDHDR